MRRPPELALEGARVDELEGPLRARGFTLGAADANPNPLRRTWLDTFDWRLHRAGLELEQIEENGTTTIELRSADDHAMSVSNAEPIAWPAGSAVLPEGTLRDRVTAVVGIRALAETASFEGTRATVRLLDDEQKTIARVHVDIPLADSTAARLSVVPLRGYDDEAAGAAVVLGSVNGVTTSSGTSYEQCLVAAGRHFDDTAPVRPGATVTAEMPASVAVAGVLHVFLSTVEANVPGVIADIDTEFLHDLRVAVRRARSTIKLAGDALAHGDAVAQLADDLKWLGDATTPTRDLDVYLLGVPELAGGLRAARPTDLDPFRAHVGARRADAFTRLVCDLGSPRFTTVLARWRAVAAVAAVDGWSSPAEPTAAEFGAARLRRAHRRVLRLGSNIDSSSPPEQLHTLRKRCKELRYLLEIFERTEPPGTRKRMLPVLKALQQCLGEFQDSEVQAGKIRTFAAEMMAAGTTPPAALLAMGELAAQLDTHQQHARATFAGIFTRFAKATKGLEWT
jgi:CHAD domain-containing protein